MEINDEMVKGFTVLSKLDNDNFDRLVDATFLILFRKRDESILTKGPFENMDQLIVKQSLSCLGGVILEGGRNNADPIAFKGVVSGYLPSPKSDNFSEKYEENREELIELLHKSNFNFPHINGVNWRLDFFIKSQSIEKENKPIIFVQLKTNQAGQIPLSVQSNSNIIDGIDANSSASTTSNVEFACSAWELLDLVGKLKDAAKQFDRLTS